MFSQPGLTKPTIKRLTKKMKTPQVYQKIFKKYTRYKKLELEMTKLAAEYEELKMKF